MKTYNSDYALRQLDVDYSGTQDHDRTQKALDIFFKNHEYKDWHGKVIADIGCGVNGGVTSFMPKDNYLIAIDPLAKEYNQRHKIKLPIIEGLGENIPLGDKVCDYTFCFNSIDHGEDYKEYFAELCRITKKRIYLYTHLRKVTELNEGHLLAWNFKEINELFNGQCKTLKTFAKDPTHEARYKTVFAIIEPK